GKRSRQGRFFFLKSPGGKAVFRRAFWDPSLGRLAMKRNILIGLSGVFFLAVLLVAGAFSQGPSGPELRAKCQKSMTDGNFKDAYEGFKKLCLDPKDDAGQVSTDLNQAVQCLQNLGRWTEVDALIEGT